MNLKVILVFIISMLSIYIIHLHSNKKCEKINEEIGPFIDEFHKSDSVIKRGVYVSDGMLYLPEMTDVLSQRDEKREAIFFTETSGNGKIKARFVCALEAAAKVNPDSDIYLLILTLTNQLKLNENEALDIVRRHHKNIQILAMNLDILFKDTILEDLYKSGKLEESKFKAAHLSDVIRILVLWKYGGKYFDLDVILIKSMSQFSNFVVEENNRQRLCNGLLGLERNSTLAYELLLKIKNSFNGKAWAANGPAAVSSVMIKRCGVPVLRMTKENCQGMQVLRHHTFFPLIFNELPLYFNEEERESTMKKINSKIGNMYGFHIGNHRCRNMMVRVDSMQPYGLIAQKCCPRSYWSCDDVF